MSCIHKQKQLYYTGTCKKKTIGNIWRQVLLCRYIFVSKQNAKLLVLTGTHGIYMNTVPASGVTQADSVV